MDTAPIIYSVEKHPEYWHLLQELWVSNERLEVEVLTSQLTLLEALVLPTRERDDRMKEAYEAFSPIRAFNFFLYQCQF